MGKFKFVKRVDLQPFGAEAGSYLEFEPMTFREGEELGKDDAEIIALPEIPDGAPATERARLETERLNIQKAAALKTAYQMMDMLKSHFIGGVIGGVTVTAEDLPDIDPLVLAEARKLVIPEPPSPNS